MVRMEKVDSQYAHFIPSLCCLVEEDVQQTSGLSNTRALTCISFNHLLLLPSLRRKLKVEALSSLLGHADTTLEVVELEYCLLPLTLRTHASGRIGFQHWFRDQSLTPYSVPWNGKEMATHSGNGRKWQPTPSNGRKWQPTPVFLPGESQGRRSLVGCCLWGCTELDTIEVT